MGNQLRRLAAPNVEAPSFRSAALQGDRVAQVEGRLPEVRLEVDLLVEVVGRLIQNGRVGQVERLGRDQSRAKRLTARRRLGVQVLPERHRSLDLLRQRNSSASR